MYSCIPNIYGNFRSYRCIEIITLFLSSQGDDVTEGCRQGSELEVGTKLTGLKPSKLKNDRERFGISF
jgi:hypothetical protein